jgi:hypothetical protein
LRQPKLSPTTYLALIVALASLAATPAFASSTSAGRVTVWRGDCGPYGHRGPWGGCIPGGRYGGGNYYFLGPEYNSPWEFLGPPTYGQAAEGPQAPDHGPRYWGTRPYDIPAFQ